MNYQIIQKESELDILKSKIEQQGEVCFDLETTSLETHSDHIRILGSGFCCDESDAFYVPFNGNLDESVALDFTKEVCENSQIGKIGHNLKYDGRVMHRFGSNIINIKFDTMIASYCTTGDQTKHNVDDLVLDKFGHLKIRTKSLLSRKSKKNPNPTLADSSFEKVGIYCCEDVYFTWKLYKYFSNLFKTDKFKAASELYKKYELPLLPVLLEMECSGVAIDKPSIIKFNDKLNGMKKELTAKILEKSGREVVLTNPNDVAKLLFEDLKIQEELKISVPRTPTGKFKTDKDTLELLRRSEIIDNILNVKKLNKLQSTYLESFPKYISPHTGLVHASFNQTVAVTGRLSSSAPNLQNQPSRDDLGREIRELYVSRWKDEGGKILAADYSQAELRILAHMANEPILIENYKKGGDAHLAVASRVSGKAPEEVSSQERIYFKTINFGMIYGMGPKKLALQLGISKEKASQLIQKYLGSMLGVKKFIANSADFLRNHGFVETYYGRRRYIPKIYSSDKIENWAACREASNHRIQGTNADIIKLAMISLHKELKSQNCKSKLILQVHDEVVLDVHPSEIDKIKPMTIDCLESVANFVVPMKADAQYGDTWLEAH